jgi:lysophospholipase L1-like esterase
MKIKMFLFDKTRKSCGKLPYIVMTFLFLILPLCSKEAEELRGVTIFCFGDSLTSTSSYPFTISKKTGASAMNCGIGGTQLGRDIDNTAYQAMSMSSITDALCSGDWTNVIAGADATWKLDGLDQRDIVSKIGRMDYSTADVFTIFFGTNDFGNERPIGLNSDTTPETFKGAINYVITRLKAAYPTVQLIFFTPVWRARNIFGDGKDSDTYPNPAGIYLIQYVDALLEVCALHDVDVFDTYRSSDINAEYAKKYLLDGLHLSRAGADHLGALFAEQLKILIPKTE